MEREDLGSIASEDQERCLVSCGPKALANEDTLLRTHCCGHIVADTKVSPFARARSICCGRKFCVRDTKKCSDFVQKHFVSATNVSQFARAR